MNNDQHEGGERRIIIDEDWKEQAQAEKEALQRQLEEKKRQQEAGQAAGAQTGGQTIPPASFASLVSSVAMQAALALQGMQVEGGPAVPPDLPLARHLIDTLEILQQKTKGNLTDDEAKMLHDVITELQLLYVETVSQLSKTATQPPTEA